MTRNPMFLLRLSDVLWLRLAERQFLGLLFQEPPRFKFVYPVALANHSEGKVASIFWRSFQVLPWAR